jgi:hypothetical protein
MPLRWEPPGVQRPIELGSAPGRRTALAGVEPDQPTQRCSAAAGSTAYYAAFHAFALAVAEMLLPRAPDEDRWGLARYVSHSSINRVCSWVSGASPPQRLMPVVARLRQPAARLGRVRGAARATARRSLLGSSLSCAYDRSATLPIRSGTVVAVG